MIEQININETTDYNTLLKNSIVDLNKIPKPLDVLLYYGFDDRDKRVGALTRGEFSCIVAQSKTKKSFNKSLIEAAFLGGQTHLYTDHIKGSYKTDGYIISVDTEQGEYYAHKTFNRTKIISGVENHKYIPIQMRKLSIKERIEMIDYIIYESEYKNKIDLLFIDGVADLVYDTNDIKEGVMLGEKLLKWSSEGNLHLSTVIHKTGRSDKARGHLGTAIQIKAETIILMDSLTDENGNYIKNAQGYEERNTVKVRCGMSRGKNFNDFYLRVDENGLPFTFDDVDNPQKPANEFKKFESTTTLENIKDVFDDECPF